MGTDQGRLLGTNEGRLGSQKTVTDQPPIHTLDQDRSPCTSLHTTPKKGLCSFRGLDETFDNPLLHYELRHHR